MTASAPPLFRRLALAWLAFFRIVFDGVFAARVQSLREGVALPAAALAESTRHPHSTTADAPDPGVALQLLALLQREGRLVDFLEQDIASFSDADVGAAARVVHEGCRKALRDHADIRALRPEEEGAAVTIEAGFAPAEVKLTGNVKGSPPYRGVLRHRGWRVDRVTLPRALKGHDASIVAPAEVDLP